MSPATNLFLPLGSRRRAWARRVYSKLMALSGRNASPLLASDPTLTSEPRAELEASLRMSYFSRQPPGYLETEQGLKDMANHLTNWLPFYHWLPDELAFKYARCSERTNFRECYDESTPERQLHFLRRGRGVSFHELQVALGTADAFDVVSYKNGFLKQLGWLSKNQMSDSYVTLLSQLVPEVHVAFLQEYLDIILRKPGPITGSTSPT
ncbi:MAG TPA: hypothetical protein VN843_32850, partial [Anaerolineales bacterium]|nr:hypothetical protein [Anaerolineales bacterium]